MSSFDVFNEHQARNIALLREVVQALEPGMRTSDIQALATSKRDAHGLDRWCHEPVVHIGDRPQRLRKGKALTRGDLIFIDLSGGTRHAFGDVGLTLCFDEEEPEVVTQAREVCRATCGYASHWKVVGELHVFATAWANNRRVDLAGDRILGHACLPPTGALAAGYPRSSLLATRLRRHQIRRLNPRRCRGAWAIRIPLTDGHRVAVFEEMIWVSDEERHLCGRSDVSEIGVWTTSG